MLISNTVITIIALTFIPAALSIRCYDCTSVNNSMCLDPTIYDKDTLHNYLTTTDCQQGAIFTAKHKEFFCRKIIQTILRKGHDSEVRVTRGCGWVRHRRDCYKADNEGHLETVCQCFTDDCNGGTSFGYSFVLAALPLLSMFKLCVL